MALLSNLYPPIMPSVIPSFIGTQVCKIYFAISKYNSSRDISNVQISLIDVKTNQTVFKDSLYPVGIKLAELQYDSQVKDDYCYFITISPLDLVGNKFELNKYYKVQLRFTSVNADAISLQTPQAIQTWLSGNMQYFSEWSRSCILRGISKPTLILNDLNKNETVELDAPLSKLMGRLEFQDDNQTDYLSEYNIKIYVNYTGSYNPSANTKVYDSGSIYLDKKTANNIIDCDIKYAFLQDTTYFMDFYYRTSCLYSQKISYSFTINRNQIPDPFNITIETVPNNQYGYIDVEMSMTIDDSNRYVFRDKTITIYRSSSKDNFNNYEKMYESNNYLAKYHSQDLSIESGIWYKYSVYVLNDQGKTVYTPVVSEPTMCVFEDIFLIGENVQLRLQFNPSITGFKYNITESQQTTIGSQYPYIRRNGENYYRTFSINGLISSLVDETDWYDSYLSNPEEKEMNYHPFTTKQEVYKDSYDLYTNYENEHNISSYLNPLYERLFREEIYDFLYKDGVKLFRSPTEGNILVYLSNISFEPISSLGRILYSFTATATEIDAATFENYQKYGTVSFAEFEIMTEAPALNITRTGNNLVLVIDATGAEQKADNIENWILHLSEQRVRKGRII